MYKSLRLFLSTLIFLFLSCSSGLAQTAPQDPLTVELAKAELQTFVVQWQTTTPNTALNATELYLFAMAEHEKHKADYAIYKGSHYQPLYALPHGAWIMGFITESQDEVAVLVDLNGHKSTGNSTGSSNFNVQSFVLNTNGQVVRVEPLAN